MLPPNVADLLYEQTLGNLLKHPYALLLQGLFVGFATWWYYVHRKENALERMPRLTTEEEDQLIEEWTPEELTPAVDPYHHSLRPRTVSSIYGRRLTVNGKECLNLATHNYLGFVENEECLEAAVNAVKKYGVGSCGPRGFFGTVDVHLKLEMEIAKFLKTEEAILYSYGYSAISSAIPAYAKVDDIIFADEGCNFSIQQGLIASRSTVHYFKHNDVADLARLLKEQATRDAKNPKVAKTRSRFVIIEGLYINYGDICPLPEIVKLKHAYKLRLFIDDSCAFGVLGAGGRGVLEHYSLDLAMDVDMIAVSLEYATAAYGGFCCGTHYIIDHQRLSGLGYCFSASLPPLQAAVGLQAIDLIQRKPEVVATLRSTCIRFSELLKENGSGILADTSDVLSPVKHVCFGVPIKEALASRVEPSPEVKAAAGDFYSFKERTAEELDTYRLEKVVDYAYEKGYALTVARYLEHMEHCTPKASIRVTVSALLSETELCQSAMMLAQAFTTVHQQFQAGLI